MMFRAIAIALVATSCGERTPPAASSATPVPAPAPAPAPAPDAGAVSTDAPVSVPDAAIAIDYRVRLSSPDRVVTVLRDGACAGPQASCKHEVCFVPAPYVDRPASRPAMVTCERDRDCSVVQTICCGPDAMDVRAVRTDQAAALPAHVCGRGRACGAPDPALIASFTVGCVEHVCRL